MKQASICILVLAVICVGATPLAARPLIGGHGIPVVAEPRDLSLVNLKPLSSWLYQDLKAKGAFGPIRRAALAIKGRQIGLPDTRKSELDAGLVIKRGSSNHSSAVLVLAGDLQARNFQAVLEKDYREYMQQTGGTAKIGSTEVEGVPLQTFAYAERPYDVLVGALPKEKMLVWAAVPRDDHDVLAETLQVLQGRVPLSETLPRRVEAETTFTLTPREVQRLVAFNAPKGKLRQTLATAMKNLSAALSTAHSEQDTLPLELRIRQALSQSDSIKVDYTYDLNERGPSTYRVDYVLHMKSPEAAKALQELAHEQVVRLGENIDHAGETEALGRIAVDCSDRDVTLGFQLDSAAAQYNHTSLLLHQMFRYQNVLGFLDRLGQPAAK